MTTSQCLVVVIPRNEFIRSDNDTDNNHYRQNDNNHENSSVNNSHILSHTTYGSRDYGRPYIRNPDIPSIHTNMPPRTSMNTSSTQYSLQSDTDSCTQDTANYNTSRSRRNRSESSSEPSISETEAEEHRRILLWNIAILADKISEICHHLLRIACCGVLPWLFAFCAIFWAFRTGGLGFGFSAFLFLISAHGVLRWWTANIPAASAKHVPAEVPTDSHDEEAANSNNPNYLNHHNHLNHNHHDEDSSSSDDSFSDDDSVTGKVSSEIVNELPPSYESATQATGEELCLHLDVHLTPPEVGVVLPSGSVGVSSAVEDNVGKKLLMVNSRRESTWSTTSCMSSEADDLFLPSYSDAVKKIKKKKRKSVPLPPERSDPGTVLVVHHRGGSSETLNESYSSNVYEGSFDNDSPASQMLPHADSFANSSRYSNTDSNSIVQHTHLFRNSSHDVRDDCDRQNLIKPSMSY